MRVSSASFARIVASVLCLAILGFGRAPNDDRSAIPAADARAAALKVLREHYAAEYSATSADAKAEFAATLLDLAKALEDSSADRYVLVDQARSLAVQAAHVQRALEAVDLLATWFVVDARAERFDTVVQLLSKPDADPTALAHAAFESADECLKNGDESGANKLTRALTERLKDSTDESLQARLRELRATVNLRLKVNAWRTQLASRPDDPTSNFELGAYECFVLGDFRHGLPRLAKGSDPKLAELARIEIDDPKSPDAQFDLAEKWFKYAETAREDLRAPILQLAATRFRAAQPRLTGLKQQLAADRLKKLGAAVESSPSAEAPTEPPSEAKPTDATAPAATASGRRPTVPPKYANRSRAAKQPIVRSALAWLQKHQSANGAWKSAEFMEQCSDDSCQGEGMATHDVGVTGLALLAFLGAGHVPTSGTHAAEITKGLEFLVGQQDASTGRFGRADRTHDFLYDHVIATTAVVEAYGLSGAAHLEQPAIRAIRYIESARNKNRAWRYAVPPNEDNDASITAWMVLALCTARDFGISIDENAIKDALAFLDEMTDSTTWRTGYMSKGSHSARLATMQERWPAERTEALTAAAMLCRIITGSKPSKSPPVKGGVELLRAQPPDWDCADFYAWYYAAHSMFQIGEAEWRQWDPKLTRVLHDHQEQSGCRKGSWSPVVDVWGHVGGRVYATAMLCLCAEAPYRYARAFR